jgi:hypothetical protein
MLALSEIPRFTRGATRQRAAADKKRQNQECACHEPNAANTLESAC